MRDADLRSQRFWDHMTYLTADRIREAERALSRQLVEAFPLDLSTVVYDATNFDTWIETPTPSEVAQRGHQKQHRDERKQSGWRSWSRPIATFRCFMRSIRAIGRTVSNCRA